MDFLKKISLNIKNPDEIYNIINNFKKINFQRSKYQKILNERIKFKGKRLAVENISNVWVELSKKIFFFNNNNLLIRLNLIIYENFKSILLVIILILKGKYKNIQTKLNYKFPKIKREIIEKELEILSRDFKLTKKIKVTKLGKKLFFFE